MLTNAKVRNAAPHDKPYRLYDEKGLYLEVHPNGSKYWRLKYRFAGTAPDGTAKRVEKRLAIGTFPDLSLKEARDDRDDARKLLREGVDPGRAKQLRKTLQSNLAVNSFGAIAAEWYSTRSPDWSESHKSKMTRWIHRDLVSLANIPISEITAPVLLAEVRKLEARGKVETAHKVKQAAGQVFRYAVSTGRAERDPSGDLKGALMTPQKTHLAAIVDPKQVGGLLRALFAYEGTPVVQAALRLAPRLFVRPGELRRMEWSEVKLDDAEWLIPGHKMKMKVDHIVPLSRQVVNVLAGLTPLTGGGQYVLPSARSNSRPMSDNAVLAALRRMGFEKDEMSGHGFRAMARTILDEKLGYRPDIIEHQLAHAVRDPNGRAYNRTAFLPQRRAMMQRWSDYLDELAAE